MLLYFLWIQSEAQRELSFSREYVRFFSEVSEGPAITHWTIFSADMRLKVIIFHAYSSELQFIPVATFTYHQTKWI